MPQRPVLNNSHLASDGSGGHWPLPSQNRHGMHVRAYPFKLPGPPGGFFGRILGHSHHYARTPISWSSSEPMRSVTVVVRSAHGLGGRLGQLKIALAQDESFDVCDKSGARQTIWICGGLSSIAVSRRQLQPCRGCHCMLAPCGSLVRTSHSGIGSIGSLWIECMRIK